MNQTACLYLMLKSRVDGVFLNDHCMPLWHDGGIGTTLFLQRGTFCFIFNCKQCRCTRKNCVAVFNYGGSRFFSFFGSAAFFV
jgi:hypothetical protein